MGCDIHLYIEQQQADRTWRRVRSPPWVCSWWLGQQLPEGRKQECYNCGGSGKTAKAFNDRNYDLFGMLGTFAMGVVSLAWTQKTASFLGLSSGASRRTCPRS